MKPSTYYEISPSVYLFGKPDTPEEKIRQWVIYELLTTFGTNINNIKVEVPVRVGTRTHYADIVVYHNYLPHIVIECKRKEDKNYENALGQAKSYSSSEEINAKYAIATNGTYWKCSKKTISGWNEIMEIRSFKEIEEKYTKIEEIAQLLNCLKYIAKYLFNTVPSSEVNLFFEHFRNYYAETILITHVDRKLYHGTDYLIRVVAHDPLLETKYGENNLRAATRSYAEYAEKSGLKGFLDTEQYLDVLNSIERLSTIIAILRELEIKKEAVTIETRLCDLALSVSLYLMKVRQKGEISSYFARDVFLIKDYIDAILKDQLKIRLPKNNEDLLEFEVYCQHSREDY